MSTTTTVSSSVPSSLPTLSSSSSPSVTIAAPSSHTTAHTGLLPLPTPNVATIYTQTSVLDKPIPRGQSQVSVAAFSYLFSEMVQYHQQRSDVIQDLEKKLSETGYSIGIRCLELYTYRSSIQPTLYNHHSNQYQSYTSQNILHIQGKKEKNLINMLQFIHSTVWKQLFGKVADGLEKSTEREDEYYIYDKDPLTNRFISIPREFGHLNCAAFIAGIINGILDAAQFNADVSAHFNAGGTRTVYVIKLDPTAMQKFTA